MKIGNVNINKQIYIIAEIGGNHNGDVNIALKLIDKAYVAGANAVKFQTYRAENLVHPDQEPLPIVKEHYDSQLERFKSLELSASEYDIIITRCNELGIDFLTSAFDIGILDIMQPYMPAIKISSGDITYHPLIKRASEFGKPVILSTGMANVEEIRAAVSLVPNSQLILLHCVSVYPLPDADVNLLSIEAMKEIWPNIVIGYSDHSIGDTACIAAATLGARVIEKHFTLDCSQRPGDHILSLDPCGMTEMVAKIRRVEKMLGNKNKEPSAGELEMKKWMRRGVYASRKLAKGSKIKEEDLLLVRPENCISLNMVYELSGKYLTRDIDQYSEFKINDFA